MSVAGTKKLQAILVRAGVLTEEQAATFATTAQQEGRPISSVIVRSGALSERDLLATIAGAAGVPPIDLTKVHTSEDVLQSMSQETAAAYGVFPVSKVDDVMTIAVANPFDVMKIDDLRLITGCTLRMLVSTEEAIRTAIGKTYDAGGKQQMKDLLGEVEGKNLDLAEAEEDTRVDLDALSSEESPIVKMVNLVIFEALKMRASDIHVEPGEKKVRIRFRVDGVLREGPSPPKKMQNPIVSRLKVMAHLDIAEKVKPQDGKFQIRFEGRTIDFRVSVLPVVHGEKVVCRVLDNTAVTHALESLGFEEKALRDFQTAIRRPYGMVLVTGPTGSGKSTTLYAAVREVVSPEINIVTVEDPVEYTMEGVNQVPINLKRQVTFAAALRSILRQDPNVILIGEIRDAETMEIAVKAALTGHLVLTTLHTNDAPSTITRMKDMGCDPFLVASSVLVVSAQRLARALCASCREPVSLPVERLVEIGFRPEEAQGASLHRAVGCARCNAGFRGRFALLETMPMTEELKRMVVEGRSTDEIKRKALEQGMLTLRRCAIQNALRGKTSVEEVLRVTMPDGGVTA
ncbi:MAG TPA: ATPase, T2SS/T4P/T4SS family [Planctomycetota bacterium]|jgi:type IV pilus assembly protein PilB|nr:ATPase, T2SS/T4P/T4SS family [Planctomycetota bacterium]